jgi:hypothetical protein
MNIFKQSIDIGKVIAKRVNGFPVYSGMPKKKPARWAVCPDFRVRPPKTVDNEAANKDYSFSVLIFSRDREECLGMLDHMIDCGREEIEFGDKRFWLHAVKQSVRHRGNFQAELKYIFRVRQVPEEIL